MENASTVLVDHVIFLLIFIFVVGMVSGRLAGLLKIPDVAMFLIAGIVVGQGLHVIHEASSSFTNQFILTIGAALILFDGGRHIRLSSLRKVWLTVVLLSITGLLITAVVMALAAHSLLGLPMIYAFLLAAIISSTDPATLIPVFKQVKIRKKIRETVESESAFNDATGSILTFTLLAVVMGTGQIHLIGSIGEFIKTAVGGIVTGIAVGLAASYLVAHAKFGFLRDYTTIAMIATGLGTFLLGEWLHVSGFMATFTAGLIWGNADLFRLDMDDRRHEMLHFSDNITVIMRMLIFILLGSQVNFAVIYEHLWTSLLLVFILMFIARPLTVILSALPDRKAHWSWKEIVFMCWVRETGVIPAALSGMVVSAGIAHGELISAVTFMAILLTILLQASTTGFVARKLDLEYERNPSQAH